MSLAAVALNVGETWLTAEAAAKLYGSRHKHIHELGRQARITRRQNPSTGLFEFLESSVVAAREAAKANPRSPLCPSYGKAAYKATAPARAPRKAKRAAAKPAAREALTPREAASLTAAFDGAEGPARKAERTTFGARLRFLADGVDRGLLTEPQVLALLAGK